MLQFALLPPQDTCLTQATRDAYSQGVLQGRAYTEKIKTMLSTHEEGMAETSESGEEVRLGGFR